MPNPYDDIFNESGEDKEVPRPKFTPYEFEDDRFIDDGKDPLDEILEKIEAFNTNAESFSKLLSKIRAIDHKVELGLARLIWVAEDKNVKENLAEERKYHDLLTSKFTKIIEPMRELAEAHLKTIQQFNRDIDKDYYSVEKTERKVKWDKANAVNGINLQRKILADATNNLNILADALLATEKRIKGYVNAGGVNNISSAEYEMLVQKRIVLTSGQDHRFDYSFFDVNILDKTAISLGIYMKETTSQYLGKLMKTFDSL